MKVTFKFLNDIFIFFNIYFFNLYEIYVRYIYVYILHTKLFIYVYFLINHRCIIILNLNF